MSSNQLRAELVIAWLNARLLDYLIARRNVIDQGDFMARLLAIFTLRFLSLHWLSLGVILVLL